MAAGLLPGFSWGAVSDIQDAINKAGRMRMLSQRMAKAYCQSGLGIVPEKSRKILDASMQLYREHLAELKTYAPTPDVRSTYEELEKVWRQYEQVLSGNPHLANAKKIAGLSEEALSLAHLATTQLELQAGTSVGRLINIAGRQRMLSQRLAKFYMFRQWGISSPEMTQQAQLAQREFISAMQALSRAPENTDKIKSELELAKTQWLFFEQALLQQGGGSQDIAFATDVATTSERILEVMDRTTGLYSKLAAAPETGGNKLRRR
ncbi:MAG: type IV pili methyl-accepting chemotaxis transducer N-terminal domain-containing protein [Betaproteobacteria bacterium]|nr:type IV pili methyl-accepting chemotaxis transducer N-terminal domain-containing protein [Betaproteobacteria bacterium]